MRKVKPDARPSDKPTALQLSGSEPDRGKLLAQTALRPSVQAAITSRQWSKSFGDLDLTKLVAELQTQISLVNNGDQSRGEALLITQAQTLNLIFNELARRAHNNMGEYMDAADRYMRLALKAQSQCRATIETLAEMKNPRPIAFVKQANIANGPQQVNNGQSPEPSCARENENQPNKLLEVSDGERLDFGATAQAIGGNSELETVATVDGPTIEGR